MPVPDTFIPAFQHLVESMASDFNDIKGTPMTGFDSPVAPGHIFQWHTTLMLPGAGAGKQSGTYPAACLISQTEIPTSSSAAPTLGPVTYECNRFPFEAAGLLQSVRAALGPSWVMTDLGHEGASFERRDKGKLTLPNGEEHILVVGSFAIRLQAIWPDKKTVSSTPSEREIANIVSAIETASHSSLPPIQNGRGSGPLTVKNQTSSTLIVYFSGATNHRSIRVPPFGKSEIALPEGSYKVAGKLEDNSVLPFFGIRNYSGGEAEEFYIGPETTPRP